MRERILFGELKEVETTDCVLGGALQVGFQERLLLAHSAQSGGCEELTASVTVACWNVATWGTAQLLLICMLSELQTSPDRKLLLQQPFLKSRQRDTFSGWSPCYFGL